MAASDAPLCQINICEVSNEFIGPQERLSDTGKGRILDKPKIKQKGVCNVGFS